MKNIRDLIKTKTEKETNRQLIKNTTNIYQKINFKNEIKQWKLTEKHKTTII